MASYPKVIHFSTSYLVHCNCPEIDRILGSDDVTRKSGQAANSADPDWSDLALYSEKTSFARFMLCLCSELICHSIVGLKETFSCLLLLLFMLYV